MPKQVDRTARCRAIAEAALRLCAREGLSAVSIGQVAAEAGVSKGLVQHYFADKADLLHATAQALRAGIDARVGEAARDAGSPPGRLRGVLVALVDLSAGDGLLLLAGHAFMAQCGADGQVRALYLKGDRAAHDAVADLIAAAKRRPRTDEDGADAHVLLALVGALADSVFLGSLDRDAALALLDRQLARIGLDRVTPG